jgi:hypothetical protein
MSVKATQIAGAVSPQGLEHAIAWVPMTSIVSSIGITLHWQTNPVNGNVSFHLTGTEIFG